MNRESLKQLLLALQQGDVSIDQAVEQLRDLPLLQLEQSCFDSQRELRTGLDEVIFAEGKSLSAVLELATNVSQRFGRVLLTRVTESQQKELATHFPHMEFFPEGRLARIVDSVEKRPGRVAVVSAGTSDRGVAEEALRSAEFFGFQVTQLSDVGVAGLHRLLAVLPQIREQDIVIVVAGMEGALPGVLAGLIEAPVIAVPTSVGYGACFSGVTALLSMLVSCSPGVSVVNIDNGFGAACVAAKFLRRRNLTELNTKTIQEAS